MERRPDVVLLGTVNSMGYARPRREARAGVASDVFAVSRDGDGRRDAAFYGSKTRRAEFAAGKPVLLLLRPTAAGREEPGPERQ
jgi:hypothetical protein